MSSQSKPKFRVGETVMLFCKVTRVFGNYGYALTTDGGNHIFEQLRDMYEPQSRAISTLKRLKRKKRGKP